MKIVRPKRYQETFRLTFSKKVDGRTEKRAFSVVETTREELDALIRHAFICRFDKEIKWIDSNEKGYVTLRVEHSKPNGKEQWSYRLWRTGLTKDVDNLMTLIDIRDIPHIDDETVEKLKANVPSKSRDELENDYIAIIEYWQESYNSWMETKHKMWALENQLKELGITPCTKEKEI